MNSELDLAYFVRNTKYQDLPAEVIREAKKFIFDTVGVGFAGASAAGIGPVVDYVQKMGGLESSTLLAYGFKVPPANAALANGSMCHARDFDCKHDRAIIHAGPVVVPAAFAVAEYAGKMSGRELINAVVLALEVHCRLGLATKKLIGWALPALYGYFAAATATAKLLGLDEEAIVNAWGIAYSQAAGNLGMIPDGALNKRLQLGFAASGGVFAGMLAEKGITGAKRSLTGPLGIFELYQRGDCDADALTESLGEHFEVMNLSYKPYPCARSNDGGIDAALLIRQKYGIKPEQIERVRVGLGSRHAYEVSCEPIAVKREPRNVVDAQFSVPYSVACALVKGKVGLEDFSDEAIKDRVVLEVSKRVSCHIDTDLEKETDGEFTSAKVEVRLKDGGLFTERVNYAKGHPLNPMSDDELESKFRACAFSGAKNVSTETVSNLIEVLNNLEQMDDISEVTELFNLQG